MIHPVDVVKSRIQALPTSCSHQECRLTGDFDVWLFAGYPRLAMLAGASFMAGENF
jgi:hypothetical protein